MNILNHGEPLASFFCKKQRLVEVAGCRLILEMDIEHRANSSPICAGCGDRRLGYDRLVGGGLEFIPLLHMAALFVDAMRRVACRT